MSSRSKWKIQREHYLWYAYPPDRSLMPNIFLTWRGAMKFVNAALSGSRLLDESR
jgi:hypothetical protein